MNNHVPPPFPVKKLSSFYRIWLPVIIFAVILLTILPFIIRAIYLEPYQLPSASMRPTLLIGDHIFCNKTVKGKDVARGDIIVFRYPDDRRKMFMKRAVALPGDTVEIRDKKLFINEKFVEEDYIINLDSHIYETRDNFGPVTIGDNYLFVLGDNRDSSHDSRFFGPVPFSDVNGKITSIYWSWDHENMEVRWSRVGMKVN